MQNMGRLAGILSLPAIRPALTCAARDLQPVMPRFSAIPTKASAESGKAFIDAAVDGLVETFRNLQGSYQDRR